MIDILPESEPETLAVVVSGRLTGDDYDKLRPELDLRAERSEPFDMLVELSDVGGLDAEAVRDDLRFTKDYGSQIGHLALVTEEPVWQGLSDLVGKPIGALLGVDVERFDDRVEAWKWLRSS